VIPSIGCGARCRSWRFLSVALLLCFVATATPVVIAETDAEETTLSALGIRIGAFPKEVRSAFTTSNGLPSDHVNSVVARGAGDVWAATAKGVARFDGNAWRSVRGLQGDARLLATDGDDFVVTVGRKVYRIHGNETQRIAKLPDDVADLDSLRCISIAGTQIYLGTTEGLFVFQRDHFASVKTLNQMLDESKSVRQIVVSREGNIAVAAQAGLFVLGNKKTWQSVQPRDGQRSWSPYDVLGVAFDGKGQLWFASPQGVGHFDGTTWSLYTGEEGLPYNDFTTIAASNDTVWFGTKIGAIRFDGETWSYRQGRAWVPDDGINDVAVTEEGDAWFATERGVGRIERKPYTLAKQADFFESAIDKYHRRTPYEYVLTVHLDAPGDTSSWSQHDSDNDGLWTGMYGAGECFAYAATKSPIAKQRAKKAFEALRFLSQVTQGGSHPAPPGFPARSILPTSGPNPNKTHSTPENDRRNQKNDPHWKLLIPRWPISEDGKWYWKTDTSSDELDGHYFLYALYHDLVADTPEEKARARDVIVAITDHLIDHDFALVDHDGKPTRWAQFGPDAVDGDTFWEERGLNSLSMLSYLIIADHVSDDAKYRKIYDRLISEHAYDANVMNPKVQNGQGAGNQSDDEMAFMAYYHLLKYETDARLRGKYLTSIRMYWNLEEPEMCPLFNFIFAANMSNTSQDPNYEVIQQISESGISDAVDALKRYPLDRVRRGFKNSHRLDVVPLPKHIYGRSGRGMLRNGKCLPIDERFVEHWNHDPWNLDESNNSISFCDGASFLLPYYMGLYHGFIIEE
jgi:hypothetical protein